MILKDLDVELINHVQNGSHVPLYLSLMNYSKILDKGQKGPV